MVEVTSNEEPRYFWTRFEGGDGERLPSGADLAALRRGVGRGPFEAPELWPFYVTAGRDDGSIPARLRAEHIALGLFALHQQSLSRLMHWPGVGVGEALRVLRNSGRFSEQAVDRRVSQAATATHVDEMARHLRSLISMLKTIETPQGLDYSALVDDLTLWQASDRVGRVRRRWGLQYYRMNSAPSTKGKSA